MSPSRSGDEISCSILFWHDTDASYGCRDVKLPINLQAGENNPVVQELSHQFQSQLKWNTESPSKSGMVETSFLSALPATAQTRGLSTKVPAMQTFLPLLLPTMKASVTVRAMSASPENN